VNRTTTRLQNDACRLPGAVDGVNNFREAAVAKGTVAPKEKGPFANSSSVVADTVAFRPVDRFF
jgi:hypothetical protein